MSPALAPYPLHRAHHVRPASLQRLAALGLKAAAALSFLAPLLTRIVVGQAFFLTGRGKWQHFENTVTFFTELGIPFPVANAAFVASLELVGGICLVLGLLTRLVSAGLLGTMVVALLTADKDRFVESWSPVGDIGPLDVAPFVFLLFFLWLALHGPGAVSLDALLKRWLRRAGRTTRLHRLQVVPLRFPDPLVAGEDLPVALQAEEPPPGSGRGRCGRASRGVAQHEQRALAQGGGEVADLQQPLAPPAQELDLLGLQMLGLHHRGGAVVGLQAARRG